MKSFFVYSALSGLQIDTSRYELLDISQGADETKIHYKSNKNPKPAHWIWGFSAIALQTQNHKPLVYAFAQTRGSPGFF